LVLVLVVLILGAQVENCMSAVGHPKIHTRKIAEHQAAAAAAGTSAANTTAPLPAAVVGSSDYDLQHAGRQLQGVPKNIRQFTGVRFESSMRAKASMVSGAAESQEHGYVLVASKIDFEHQHACGLALSARSVVLLALLLLLVRGCAG
jgi:hypothetical protein